MIINNVIFSVNIFFLLSIFKVRLKIIAVAFKEFHHIIFGEKLRFFCSYQAIIETSKSIGI